MITIFIIHDNDIDHHEIGLTSSGLREGFVDMAQPICRTAKQARKSSLSTHVGHRQATSRSQEQDFRSSQSERQHFPHRVLHPKCGILLLVKLCNSRSLFYFSAAEPDSQAGLGNILINFSLSEEHNRRS